MTVQHNTLTGSQLHEPKGAASATSGQIYVADGAGSGAFQDPTYLDAVSATTDNGVARFDGTAGTLQDSGVTIDDSDNVTVPGTVAASAFTENGTTLSSKYQTVIVAEYKAANETRNNTTTLATDSALAGFGLDASTNYLVEGKLYFSDGTGTASFKSAFQLASGSINDSGIVYTVLDPGATPNADSSGVVAITDTYSVTSLAADELREITVGGFVEVTNAATFNLQWAQAVADTVSTTLNKASYLKFTEIV